MVDDGLRRAIEDRVSDLVELRHALHQCPELSGAEERTSALMAERLRGIGLKVRTGVGGHGVVADLVGGLPGRRIALRADMDALPVVERTGCPYASRYAGVMHACGHDGHMAILLGVARVLAGRARSLRGSVRFLFQPAEETINGALHMCQAGALDGVDAIVALHGWPRLPVGRVAVAPGVHMASADMFRMVVRGVGGHAGYPHEAVDPIVVAANIVTAAQTVVSRQIDPLEPAVLTFGKLAAGSAPNVIPGEAEMLGTYRALSEEVRLRIAERLCRVASNVCAAFGAEFTYERMPGPPPLANHPAIAALVADAARDTLSADGVETEMHPSMIGEDFAEYLQTVPGAMFRLGLGDTAPVHSDLFDFNDRAIPVGIEVLCRTALRFAEC